MQFTMGIKKMKPCFGKAMSQIWTRPRLFFTCLLVGLVPMTLWAQPSEPNRGYPSKPIRLVVPFSPGGPNDVAARLIVPYLSERLKQSVIIVNTPGAGGRIGSKMVAAAAADGYTLLMGGTNLNVVVPVVYKTLDYNPVSDFTPVGAIATDAMLFAVHPSVPAVTIRDFLDYVKRSPGKISAGSVPGIGPHFAIEMFKLRTGADITFVPYKGAAPAIQDAIGGHLTLTVTNKSVLLPFIQSGQLRGLAVTSAKRLAELPEIPTLKESGIEGVPSLNWYGLLAPARTPQPLIDKLRAILTELSQSDALRRGLVSAGLDPQLDEADFAGRLANQRNEWAQMARESRISLD